VLTLLPTAGPFGGAQAWDCRLLGRRGLHVGRQRRRTTRRRDNYRAPIAGRHQ
jgi:hypothetical protein